MYTNAKSPPPKSALHMSGLSMLTLDRHRRNGYSIESFVVNQRGSPVGIKKKVKKELIGTSDYPSIKGGAAIKQALTHPEDEDIDFLNPEIED